MLEAARDRLASHQGWLDRLNVFPVADSDTGRNLVATLAHVADAARRSAADEVSTAVARAAIRAARGNSGVIMAEWLRGFVTPIPGSLRTSLDVASEHARAAVTRPVEGTILTVARDAAASAEGCSPLEIVASARRGAEESLERTTGLLPVLARHGVVDAGGAGLVCVLDGFVSGLGGDSPRRDESIVRNDPDPGETDPARVEVMVTIQGTAEQVERIEREWERVGDSVAVAGTGDLWRLHVHSDRPDEALAVAKRHGAVIDHLIEPLAREDP